MMTFKDIEGFTFDVSGKKITNVVQALENDYGVSQTEEMAEEFNKEESAKDG
jgi:hypothetical protein